MDEDLVKMLEQHEGSRKAGTIDFNHIEFKARMLLVQEVRNLNTTLSFLCDVQRQVLNR